MRVCLDLSCNEMLDRNGGFGRYARCLLDAIYALPASERAGLELYALPRSDRPPVPAEEALGHAILERPEIATWRHQQQRTWLLGPLLRARRIQLFHSTTPSSLPLAPGCPVIGTCYDIIPAVLPKPGRGLGVSLDRQKEWLEQYLRNWRPQHLVAISEATRQDLVRVFGFDPRRITVIHLGVDASRFSAEAAPGERDALRARHQLPERWFVSVGSDHYRKNQERLVEAWRRVADQIPEGLVLVGKALYCSALQRLEEETHRGDAGGRFRWLKNVGDDDLTALYRHATAAVAPSLYEGFGLTLLEAMACGAPVTAARASSHPEVGGDAALYFDPLSVDELAARLVELSAGEALRARLRAAGREQVGRFTWEETARSTLALYKGWSSARC